MHFVAGKSPAAQINPTTEALNQLFDRALTLFVGAEISHGDPAGDGLAAFGDDDFFATGGFTEQPRERLVGLAGGNGFHGQILNIMMSQ